MPNQFDFSDALIQIKAGERVARSGWNGKNMCIYLVDHSPDIMRQPYVEMKTAQGSTVPWLCSQTDMLATDWEIVND